MVQILPEVPGFGTMLARGLGEGFSQGSNRMFEHALKLKEIEQQNLAKKKQENLELRDRGLQAISHMRDILSKGNTGLNLFNYLTEGGRSDRSAMDAAALNLERLAVEMQGKGALNKQRFDYMTKRLPSSFKSDAANYAILDEWEKILTESEKQKNSLKEASKTKFNPKNKEHISKYNQLKKTYGEDSKKINEALAREFTL